MTASKSFNVSAGGSTVLYFNGHPDYDSMRVEFDGANSGSTSTDVTYKTDTNNNFNEVKSAGFGSMDYTVKTSTGLDPSTGVHDGNTAMSRIVAVEINEQGATSNAQGTVYLHNSSDPAENADSFANR